jgi:hypothetical protein
MEANAYEQREKNVFYEIPEFKMRIIDLAPGLSMQRCDMTSHVVFVCIEGKPELSVGNQRTAISRCQCLVTKPATISMNSDTGVQLLGIQITTTSNME